MLNTQARNAAFKINMPHSQARMPEDLPQEQIKSKPIIAQRKNVHSYIYPTKVDLMRHEMKMKLKGCLSYDQTIQNNETQKYNLKEKMAPAGPIETEVGFANVKGGQNNSISQTTIQDYESSLQEHSAT